MLDKVKAALAAAKDFFTKKEPVVVLNTLLVGAVTLQQAVTAELDTNDGWAAVGFAVLTVIVRQLVTPAAK